jgi:hypothetical protein
MCCDSTGHALSATNNEEAKVENHYVFLYMSQVRKKASATSCKPNKQHNTQPIVHQLIAT